MSSIEIITDSTCDIPQEMIDQYGIDVVSHYVIWGDEQYLDRVNLQPQEFYQRLITDKTRPTSAQASLQDFLAKYEAAILHGAKEIIVITVSSAMSGAYQMAQNAAKLVKIPVHVVDSKGPTMTLGWQVLEAARKCISGDDVQSILKEVDHVRSKLVQVVGMDTLDYLQKGGRIGDAAKWIGSVLNIKPVVTINHQTGRVEPATITRTHKNMVETVYNKFFEKIGDPTNLHVAVLHGNVLPEAEALAERIKKEFNPKELMINITGPVLGINTGPGALALCGYAE